MEVLQTAAAYISVGATFILFLIVIVFHVYRYGNGKVYSLGQTTKLGKKVKNQMSYVQHQNHWMLLNRESDIYQLFDVFDNHREGGDHTLPLVQQHEEPTSSVVSMTDCDESQ